MQPTSHVDINQQLDSLLKQIRTILGNQLIGFYLYGSLVWGDFDHEISDIDLLAAISEDLHPNQLDQLREMHTDFARLNPQWDNRIEVQCLSLKGIRTFKSQTTKMAVISPGEPFHQVEAGKEWLMNWYFVQEHGRTLFGPLPKSLIEPISHDEFILAVKEHALSWREHVANARDSRSYQSYAVLTLCRALYSIKHGTQVSKKQAAAWAQRELPQWSQLIDDAMLWRSDWRNKNVDPELSYPRIVQFVNYVANQIT